MEENKYEDDGHCFACGDKNPVGLHLKFVIEDDAFVTDKVISDDYQSFRGIVHGGIITTMLDEAMGGYLFAVGKPAVTGKLSVRYRKPTPTNVKLHIRGWVVAQRGNYVDMKSEITLEDGTVTAEATAKMAILPQ